VFYIFNLRGRSRVPTGAPEYILVGLGNPGKKYEFTRHNAGYLCLDALAQNQHIKINRIKFKSLTGETTIAGHRCLLLKPQTFMNNSGEAVREAADFYKIPAEKILVIFDDTTLSFGNLRIRRNGSDGGHNGLKSIVTHIKSNQFPRIKIGIGTKPHPEMELANWVLSSFNKKELTELRSTVEKAHEALELMVEGNFEKAMAKFN
jgi:PTH1 family peptidyl-tRNA hydrolase